MFVEYYEGLPSCAQRSNNSALASKIRRGKSFTVSKLPVHITFRYNLMLYINNEPDGLTLYYSRAAGAAVLGK